MSKIIGNVQEKVLLTKMKDEGMKNRDWWKVCACQQIPENEDYAGLNTPQNTKDWMSGTGQYEKGDKRCEDHRIPSVLSVLPECLTTLISGQAALTVILLAIMVQEAARRRDLEEAGTIAPTMSPTAYITESPTDSYSLQIQSPLAPEDDVQLYVDEFNNLNIPWPSTEMIVFLSSLLLIFVMSIFRVFEKRAREIAFYASFNQGVIIDFRNKLVMNLGATAGFKNIGSLFLCVLAGIAAYIFYEAAKSEGDYIAYFSVALALFTVFVQLYKLQAAYRQLDMLEEHLISLPKFLESNPKLARSHLDACKMQDEGVCFTRLSDIMNIQIYQEYRACVIFAATKGYLAANCVPAPSNTGDPDKPDQKDQLEPGTKIPSERCDKKGLLKMIWKNKFAEGRAAGTGEKKLSRKEKFAMCKELEEAIHDHMRPYLFTWNQLRTEDVNDFKAKEGKAEEEAKANSTYEGAEFKTTKLQKIVWKSNAPTVALEAVFRVTDVFKGRYITLFESIKFKDKDMINYSNTFVTYEQRAVALFAVVFIASLAQGFNFD